MSWVLGVLLGVIVGVALLIILPRTVSNPQVAAASAEAAAAPAGAEAASAATPAATASTDTSGTAASSAPAGETATGSEAAGSEAAATGNAGNAESGQTYFASNCAGCHGANAEGGMGPKLEPAAGWTLAQFGSAVHEGKAPEKELSAVMPRFSKEQLNDTQLADVHAYLQKTFNVSAPAASSSAGTAVPTEAGANAAAPAAAATSAGATETTPPAAPESSAGVAAEGQTKFAGTCAGCHGANAEGGVGPALAATKDWTDAQFTAALREGKSPEKELSAVMPRFTPDAVSDADIANMHAYLKSLN